MRTYNSVYTKGQWKVQCDRCGFDYKSGQLRREWTGLMTCHGSGTNDCWEPRNEQDFVRGVPDRQAPEWARPAGVDNEPFVLDGGTDPTPEDL